VPKFLNGVSVLNQDEHLWKVMSSSKRSTTKALVTGFFGRDGVVHHELAPEGHKINKEYYLQALRRLRETTCRKLPEKWSSGDWQILHDNAPAHSAQLVQRFLAKHEIPHVQQLPYSLDIAPCNFFSFSKIKLHLKRRFDYVEIIKQNMMH
jgi:hypothetical protein